MNRDLTFHVNGQARKLSVDEERPLLDVLREDLSLTGTKYGCGEGECGACTVLVDGAAIRSCITSVGEVDGLEILTIEGLAPRDGLHPVQQSFLDNHALQCGFCVPGQIMTAVAFLKENPQPTREEVIAAMSDNICRCCNYPNILAAVEQAAGAVRV